MQVFYQVEDWCDGESGEFYECETAWSFNFPADVAKDCGEDAFHNHDGWESSWPLTILIYESPYKEAFKGRFEVEMEAVPSFFARAADKQSPKEGKT